MVQEKEFDLPRFKNLDEFLNDPNKSGYLFNRCEGKPFEILGKPWMYDMKFQFNIEKLYDFYLNGKYKNKISEVSNDSFCYNGSQGNQKIYNLRTIENPIERWLCYRHNGVYDIFDCDGSKIYRGHNKQGFYCGLIREVYRTLWNWNDLLESKDDNDDNKICRVAQSVYCKENNKEIETIMQPETMNSGWVTFALYCSELDKTNFKWSKQTLKFVNNDPGNYTDRLNKLIDGMNNDFLKNKQGYNQLKLFMRNCGCIGNFTLTEDGKNIFRYFDYWDLKLNDFYKNEPKYINTFFHWDYMQAVDEKEYIFKPLFKRHSKNEGSLLPQQQQGDFEELFKNMNAYIERRGIFMVAMLRIATLSTQDKDYEIRTDNIFPGWNVSKIYKIIMKEVFLKNKIYNGYNHVIKSIEEVCDEIYENKNDDELKEIKDILIKAKEEINNVEKYNRDKQY